MNCAPSHKGNKQYPVHIPKNLNTARYTLESHVLLNTTFNNQEFKKNRYDRFFLVVSVCLTFKEKAEEFLSVHVNIDLLSAGRLPMFLLMRYRGREFWVIT